MKEKIKKSIKIITFLIILSFILLTLGNKASAIINPPIWHIGDNWHYFTNSSGNCYYTNWSEPCPYENENHLYYNITGEKTYMFNGTNISVFIVNTKSFGAGHQTEPEASYNYSFMINTTKYISKNNYSIVWEYEIANKSEVYNGVTTISWFATSITQTETTYISPEILIKYPLNIDNLWYSNYSFNYKSYEKSQLGAGPWKENWYNGTEFQNYSNYCDKQEMIGTYDSYRIVSHSLDYPNFSPEIIWVSEYAGNYIQKISEYDYPSNHGYSYTILMDGHYNGNTLPKVPTPTIFESSIEFILVMMIVTTILAFFYTKKD